MAGLSYMNYLPSLVQVLAGDLGYNEVEAGQIVAVNGYGGLLGICIAILIVNRIAAHNLMIILLLLLSATDISTMWISDYSLMLGWRFLSGLIGGVAVGMAFSELGKTTEPDRGFGFLLFIQFGIGSIVIVALPWLELKISAYAVFYVMAGITLLSMFFQLLMPKSSSLKENITAQKPLTKISNNQILLLVSIGLYQVAASAIWAYLGLIGQAAKLDSTTVSVSIASVGLLGLLGAMLPIVKGSKIRRFHWVLLGICLSAVSSSLLHKADLLPFYLLSMAILFLVWPAVQSFLLAVAAELDASGRLSTTAALLSYLGLATGPLLGSYLFSSDLTRTGLSSMAPANNISAFDGLFYFCSVIFLLCAMLLYYPVKSHEKFRHTEQPERDKNTVIDWKT